MSELFIDFETVTQAQEEYLQSEDKVFAYIGGLGSGKTHIGAADLIMDALRWKKADFCVAANSYQQLNTATVPKLLELLSEWNIPYKYNKNPSDMHVQLQLKDASGNLLTTGKIHIRSLENYDVSLRGIEILKLWMDEARDTEQEAFLVALGRIRQNVVNTALRIIDAKGKLIHLEVGDVVPKGVSKEVVRKLRNDGKLVKTSIRITTTPDMMKARWLYDYLHDADLRDKMLVQGVNFGSSHAKTTENPYLDPAYFASLKAMYDDQQYEQEVNGEWRIMTPGIPVYGSVFNSHLHLGEFKYNKYKTLYCFWDFGWHHPAFLVFQEDDNNRLQCLGELLGSEIELNDFCEDVWLYLQNKLGVELSKNLDIVSFCDPAGTQKNDKSPLTSIQTLKKNGFKLVRYKKHDIPDGISCVRRQLNRLIAGHPALQFDDRNCPITLEAIRGGYHYKDDSVDDRPNKDGYYDHLMDALRYGIVCLRYVDTNLLKKNKKAYKQKWQVHDKDMGY